MRKNYRNFGRIVSMNARQKGNKEWWWQISILVGPGNDGKIKYFGAMLFYMETKEVYRFALDSLHKSMGERAPLKTKINFADGFLNQSDVREGQFYFADSYNTWQTISKNLGRYYSGRVKKALDKDMHATTQQLCDHYLDIAIDILSQKNAATGVRFLNKMKQSSEHMFEWGIAGKLTMGLKGSQMSESSNSQLEAWFKSLILTMPRLFTGICKIANQMHSASRIARIRYNMICNIGKYDDDGPPRFHEPVHIADCRKWGSEICTERVSVEAYFDHVWKLEIKDSKDTKFPIIDENDVENFDYDTMGIGDDKDRDSEDLDDGDGEDSDGHKSDESDDSDNDDAHDDAGADKQRRKKFHDSSLI
ncbi:hypothetical protein SARC_02620 [Sphaeroforma arctica JP610]|uniref:Uncharacterized protein n=1 Tax=Sphaeroforma arctica JP610 TaxID=667725 RepID=A0A0L0G8J8_9EUKA|nr:hypothetical protein SARC_02620 [Sphaeroforma arctica JP610]KNC85201.1 hypothetical protein SARC_02620 [Sphaeroforma arctica JP610]|eukprot:XP_014159103.1 hypothetical protein SARC_02620 [Sphaeroforma arctica JP610]